MKGLVNMKKQICWLLAALTVFAAGCGGSSENPAAAEKSYIEYGSAGEESSSMETVAENDFLILRINRATTDIELEQKATGYIWSSRGSNATDSDGKPLSFTYLDNSGSVASMDTAADSVAKGQYKIEKTENGVHIIYSFGDIVKDLIYPTYISAERFEKLTEKMSSRSAATITPLYQHLVEGIYDDDTYADMIRKYPNAKGKDAYVIRNSDMLLNVKKELASAFSEAGYSAEELAKDNAEFGLSSGVSSSQSVQFNIGVEYTLEDGDLKVRLPADEMYCSAASTGIETLSLLPYFGAPESGAEGYFLLPDGSGAVMEFYNGSEHAGQVMFSEVYGENLSISKEEKIYSLSQTVFPVYGAKIGNSAYLAVIEKGDAIARLNALPGTDTLAARAWADFNILDTQIVYAKSLAGAGDIAKNSYTKEQSEPYSGDIAIRYHFLDGDAADYSGMARYYRDKLFPNGNSAAETVPFYLETVSAIDYTEKRAGFTKHTVSTLTTFEEAAEMSETLRRAGVTRQKLILSGWQKNGWQTGYANSQKVNSAAGGENGLRELAAKLKNNGAEFFPETDVQLVYPSAISGGVDKSLTARSLVQQLTRVFKYKQSDFQKNGVAAYGMNAEYTQKAIASAAEYNSKLGISGLSLRYAAQYVIPDYKEGSVTNRAQAMEKLADSAEKAAESGMSLLSRTGNAPVAVHTGDIVELPLYSNGNYNCTYPVPFAAMVYSGNIDYAGKAANLSGTGDRDILKMIESGAGVYFAMAARADNNIRSSTFDRYYSICFDDLSDTAVSTYKKVATALNGVYGSRIERHERLQPNVYKTVFENGTYFIVNYNGYEITADGLTVAAAGYIRGENG